LTEARRIAKARPSRRSGRRRDQADQAGAGSAARTGGYSGPAPDDRDPQPVGRLLAGYVEERGWELPLAEARVFADWAALVGPDVAMHSTPVTLRDGELKVSAESTAWATQLRLLTAALLSRLAGELGPNVVTKLVITGPLGPSWKHGGYSVRGTRGPRDTYG
jgi:predicted nucleic acid-binding Zn ribbon protein